MESKGKSLMSHSAKGISDRRADNCKITSLSLMSHSAKGISDRRADDCKITSLGQVLEASKAQEICKGPWTNLPDHILSDIIPHFSYLEDYLALSSICKSWKMYTASCENPPLPPRYPVLMLVRDEKYERETDKYLENLATIDLKNKLSIRICKVKLSGPGYRICMGTSFGWVLTLDMDLQISIIHPFFGDHNIQLPPNPSFMDWCECNPERNIEQHTLDVLLSCLPPDSQYTYLAIKKAALSSNPRNNQCIVMGIFSSASFLAFARPGDRCWTIIASPRVFYDIIYYKDNFYSVDYNGVLCVCDIDDSKPKAREITPPHSSTLRNLEMYLVESSGDLFLVSSDLHSTARLKWFHIAGPSQGYTYSSNELSVHKLVKTTNDEGRDNWYWEQVHDLGNAAFLVGASTSVSLTSADNNGFYKGNHIYFTDEPDLTSQNYLLTVANMENETVESFWLNRLYKFLPVSPFFYM